MKWGHYRLESRTVNLTPGLLYNADLPIPLRSFILMKKVNKEQEKKDEFINYADDDDFDLMFSNSKESLVGSFHNVSLGIHDLSLLS